MTDRPLWKLHARWVNHCPGGCYIFITDHPDRAGRDKRHIPVDRFWGGPAERLEEFPATGWILG